MKIFFYLIFLLSFLIRLISLNQPLWLDEAITVNVVKNYSFFQIIFKFSPFDFHPPLYYLFMKIWAMVFGFSEISLRMPSVIFSLLTGYFIYLIGKNIQGKKMGFWAMTFFLFNPLIVYYSQEARMYMMITMFLTISLYFLHEMTRMRKQINTNKQIVNILFFNLFIVLSLLTFYGSIFLIAAIIIYLLYKRQYKIFFISLFIIIYSLFIISPLLYQQLLNAKISLSNVTNWHLVLGKANLKNLFLIPIKFSIGRISFYPKWLYYLIAGCWGGFLFFKIFFKIDKKPNKNEDLFLFLFFLPIFFGFIISFFTPLLQYFRFLYLIPIFCFLLFLRLNTTMLRSIVVFGFIFFSFLYLLNSNYHREDWNGLAKTLPKKAKVFMIPSSSDPLKYYRDDVVILSIENLKQTVDKKIIVIPYSTDIWGFDYQKILKNKSYFLEKKVDFRGVFYEIYKKD